MDRSAEHADARLGYSRPVANDSLDLDLVVRKVEVARVGREGDKRGQSEAHTRTSVLAAGQPTPTVLA